MRYRLFTAIAAAALAGSAMTAAAQETYPSKPIRVIVPEAVSYTHLTLPTIYSV